MKPQYQNMVKWRCSKLNVGNDIAKMAKLNEDDLMSRKKFNGLGPAQLNPDEGPNKLAASYIQHFDGI